MSYTPFGFYVTGFLATALNLLVLILRAIKISQKVAINFWVLGDTCLHWANVYSHHSVT